METLTPPNTEAIQPPIDTEVLVDGMTVAYHQQAGARRTEYTGDTSAIIDGGESGGNSLGSFEMGDVSLPVVAKFTVENKPQSYQRGASPESEFLVVDIRGLGLQDTLSTSVGGFKTAVETGQRFGKINHAEDAPQYALVNVTSIQRRGREGGSLFSISTISRDTENPTVIRRDHTLHGEATVDTLSSLGMGESNVTVTSDENGKLVVTMAQESNSPITFDTASELLGGYQPQYAEAEAHAERVRFERKLLGKLALEDLLNADTLSHYKAAYGLHDAWAGPLNFNLTDAAPEMDSDWGEAATGSTSTVTGPESSTGQGPLQTTEDVYNRIADLRAANMSDKQIKKTLLRDLHPDSHPGINPDLAKVVTDEFRPKPQEYRDQVAEPRPTYTEPSQQWKQLPVDVQREITELAKTANRLFADDQA